MTIEDIDIKKIKEMDFRYKRAYEVDFNQLDDSSRKRLFKILPDYQDEHLEIARACRLATDILFSFDEKPKEKRKHFKDLLTAALKHYQRIVRREEIISITDEQAEIYLEKSKTYFPKSEEKGMRAKMEKSKTIYELLEGKTVEKMIQAENPNTQRTMYFETGSWKPTHLKGELEE